MAYSEALPESDGLRIGPDKIHGVLGNWDSGVQASEGDFD